jgi:Glycosyl hydrolase family 26
VEPAGRASVETDAVRAGRVPFVVLVIALVIAAAACDSPAPQEEPDPTGQPVIGASPEPTGPVVADVDQVLGDGGPLFGVYQPDKSAKAVTAVATKVGCRPALQQIFASVEDGISTKTLLGVSGLTILSLEPWTTGGEEDQPAWSLSKTIEGHWDRQYEAIARSVVEFRDPILVRFAHEMNAHWYPWGTTNGNKRGQFVAAWKHVVDMFRKAGATNALWVWSPNILRGAGNRPLKEFWPGESYVDVVGLTGYGVREENPNITYRSTLKQVYELTDKPIVLTEVGVQPGSEKRPWLKAFGGWLRDNPQVAGFVWNQVTRDGDWRYDDNAGNLAAFKSSLKTGKVRC